MTFIDPNKSVSEILEMNPQYVQVLDRFHVDYGFAGALSLTEACLQQGLDLQELLRQLRDAGREEAFRDDALLQSFEIPELVGYILSTHHDFLEKELPRLRDLFNQALRTRGEQHPELLGWLALFSRFQESMENHMKKQGKRLFPLFLLAAGSPPKAGLPDLESQIRDSAKEEDRLRQDLVRLRRMTEGYQVPGDADRTLRDLVFDLETLETEVRRHLRVENDILFPKVLEKAKLGPAALEPNKGF